ncbi:MAG TPA: hypothetical protein V6C58_14115 [Allocoleopsis sp.]
MVGNNKALLLKRSLLNFYKNKEYSQQFIDVLHKNTEYSLRIIEWFCSNYSKKNNVIYTINKKDFNVYLSYKAHLDSYQKKQFDPFRREHKGFEKFGIKLIGTEIKDPIYIETTVGQLNFFKWCIENKIFDYIQKHITHIKEDMNKSIKKSTKKNDSKRQPLSPMAIKTCVRRFKKVTLDFE